MPGTHVYDQLVGPFHDTAGLVRWLGVTRQALAKRTTAGTLIGCQLADGTWVYPAWQFTATGVPHPDLLSLWQVLRTGADPWTCASWLRAPNPALGGCDAVTHILEEHPVDPALDAAHADAERWAA